MIHLESLPGTPMAKLSVNEIIDLACKDALVYKQFNLHGLLIENMNDLPYIKSNSLTPEISSVMTRVCTEVKRIVPDIPTGDINREETKIYIDVNAKIFNF